MLEFFLFCIWMIVGAIGTLIFFKVENTDDIEDRVSLIGYMIVGGLGGVMTLVISLVFRSILFKPKGK